MYAVIFMGSTGLKVKKEGIIQKCTAYAYIGVDIDDQKEILSLQIGEIENAKY